MNKEIYTERTKLRKYKNSDKDKFAELFTDTEINFHMGGPKCETIEDAVNLFEKCFAIYDGALHDRHFEIWGIEMNGELIGHFELKQTNHTKSDELEVIYLLDKKYWGNGIMPEVLKAVNNYALLLGKQLTATISRENTKTVRALEKVGIEKEEWVEDEEGKVLKVWIKK